MVAKVFGSSRCAMRVQIMRGRTDNRVRIEQLARDQRRVPEVADAYRKIGALLDQVDAPVVEIEVETDARVAPCKCRDRLAHVPHAE